MLYPQQIVPGQERFNSGSTSHTPESKHFSGVLISIHSASSSFMNVDNVAPQIH